MLTLPASNLVSIKLILSNVAPNCIMVIVEHLSQITTASIGSIIWTVSVTKVKLLPVNILVGDGQTAALMKLFRSNATVIRLC